MTYPTLESARLSLIEFAPWMRRQHSLVRLRSGRWTRVLGTPQGARHVRGNLWTVD